MKFSANLSFLYPELGFLERFAAAARDGFPAVEYLGPYAEPKQRVAEALVDNGLVQALFNVPSGDWAGGERGIAALPGRSEEFRAGIATALDYATTVRCEKLNVIAGLVAPGADLEAMEATLVDNLRYAAPRCAEAGIKLLIEPINLRDIPRFFLSTTAHAERILERVGHDNLYIQYDLYHMQVMQGDLLPTYQRLRERIAHIQLADTPGRNEPGTGEINYGFVLPAIERLGYDGYFGCEYKPRADTSAGLGWMQPYLRSA
ncbi:hydroxypyruvate isomerase [Devosia sp. Root413D1]|uniref:2-oxo-tetronate isomerase n=1 Tax=Devosia sp. Root413D1 TaxID=1736531 RepID=UPI0006FC6766|nr:2-oxo-tetronate isomerase [Devosia sp. Root413D1]KQW75696.1 hydroxypyruvate isomerase [Devosia sp. Root413D1]